MLRGASSACTQSICTGAEVDGKAINQPAERRHGAVCVCVWGDSEEYGYSVDIRKMFCIYFLYLNFTC